ncbi:deoxynucleoside triphosphate triphosphohydrolase SAMHD1-like isoform X2 [Rana temporaria]|nr:deoxynucleoside triphosphate triphosphohydrolase SAMHD1-like isoform X2 [Rana temporaria]
MKHLQDCQGDLGIDDRDILRVQIAGLCHDLGHGPFSHMFDRKFMPHVCPHKGFKHESASLKMFEHIMESIKSEIIMGEEDKKFIKELIKSENDPSIPKSSYEGQREEKSFLYDIVANKRNGIDVDKWDYFARDCHHLGIANNFDHMRCLKFARVCEVDNRKQICFRDKEVDNLYNMFYTRNSLHRRAYQHKVNNIIEIMIMEAFVKADPYIKIQGSKGKMSISESVEDMEAYTKLTDNMFHQILYSSEPELEEAREILQKVERRELYKFVGERLPGKAEDCTNLKTELVNDIFISIQIQLQKDDFIVDVIDLNYGMKDQDPINNVRFYRKLNPDMAIKITQGQVSLLLPTQFEEQIIRVYCKKTDENILEAAKESFEQWCQKHGCKPQQEPTIASAP